MQVEGFTEKTFLQLENITKHHHLLDYFFVLLKKQLFPKDQRRFYDRILKWSDWYVPLQQHYITCCISQGISATKASEESEAPDVIAENTGDIDPENRSFKLKRQVFIKMLFLSKNVVHTKLNKHSKT